MLPSVGVAVLRIMRERVVLPLPDSPMMVKISGRSAARLKLTWSTALKVWRESTPPIA